MLMIALLQVLLLQHVLGHSQGAREEWVKMDYLRRSLTSTSQVELALGYYRPVSDKLAVSSTSCSTSSASCPSSRMASSSLKLFPCSERGQRGVVMVINGGVVDGQQRLHGLVHLRRAQEQDRLQDCKRCVSINISHVVNFSSALAKKLSHVVSVFNHGQVYNTLLMGLDDSIDLWLISNDGFMGVQGVLQHRFRPITHLLSFEEGRLDNDGCQTMVDDLLVKPTPCLHMLASAKSAFSRPEVTVINMEGHVYNGLLDHRKGLLFHLRPVEEEVGVLSDVQDLTSLVISVNEGSVKDARKAFKSCFSTSIPKYVHKWPPLMQEVELTEETASPMVMPLVTRPEMNDAISLLSDWEEVWRDDGEPERKMVRVRIMDNVKKHNAKLHMFNTFDKEANKSDIFTGVFRLDVYNDEAYPQKKESSGWTVSTMEGVMISGKVEGRVLIRSKEQKLILGWAVNGVLHGSFIVLGVTPQHVPEYQSVLSAGVGWFGVYESGRTRGHFWKEMVGGGLIHGHTDNITNLLFVYPDSIMSLHGQFTSNFELVEAKEAFITGLSCQNGVLIANFEMNKENDNTYTYNPSTNTSYGSQPHLRDPYDAKNVEVKTSSIENASEGAFARRFLPKGRVVGFYDGLRQSLLDNQYEPYRKRCTMNETLSDDVRRSCTMYNINFSSWRGRLVIPPWLQHRDNYTATSIHKVNCGFRKEVINVKYADFDHPRLGLVVSVVTLSDIEKNAELIVDYNYEKGEFPYDYKWYFDIKERMSNSEKE